MPTSGRYIEGFLKASEERIDREAVGKYRYGKLREAGILKGPPNVGVGCVNESLSGVVGVGDGNGLVLVSQLEGARVE